MSDSSSAPQKETPAAAEAQESSSGFRADLPLAILESIRAHDRPTEVLEDEDLSASLPRRLGLTGVVDNQIHRYTVARRRRERIPRDEVGDLFRLVLRRPDCEPILKEAGHDLARHHVAKPLYRLTTLARLLPDALSSRIAKRSVRRLLARITGGSATRVIRTPFQVEISRPITAEVDKYGIACVLYAAAIEEAVQHAYGRRPRVEHTECVAQGGERCLWTVATGA